jgi:hypothetical protein
MLIVVLFAVPLGAWENYGWLTEYDWCLEMDDEGLYIDWIHIPYGTFRKNNIPRDNAIYRRRIRAEYFDYFYPLGGEQVSLLGYDRDHDGLDDILHIYARDNYSVVYITDREDMILAGGARQGGKQVNGHPLIGLWGKNNLSEFRMVDPADYPYYLELEKIPGFSIRRGIYLLKQTEKNVFESDSSFPDGHIRLEIRDEELIVLTPLFDLPPEEGMLEPLFMRRIPREDK